MLESQGLFPTEIRRWATKCDDVVKRCFGLSHSTDKTFFSDNTKNSSERGFAIRAAALKDTAMCRGLLLLLLLLLLLHFVTFKLLITVTNCLSNTV
jgi:hypothetical protein